MILNDCTCISITDDMNRFCTMLEQGVPEEQILVQLEKDGYDTELISDIKQGFEFVMQKAKKDQIAREVKIDTNGYTNSVCLLHCFENRAISLYFK